MTVAAEVPVQERRKGARWSAVKAALVIALLGLALAVPEIGVNEYTLDVLIRFAELAILACGLNIVVAKAGLLDLGYIAFMGVGAYATAILSSPQFNLHMGLPATTLISALVAIVFALLIGYPTLRVRGDFLAIVTLGFGEIVRVALNNMVGLTGGPNGIQAVDPPRLFGYTFGFLLRDYYYLAISFLALAVLASWALNRSALGIAWDTLRNDEIAAMSVGVRPVRTYLWAFAAGAAYAGVAGSLFARVQTVVSPDSFVVGQSFLILTMVVLGGLSGRLVPLLIAVAALTILPEALRTAGEYRLVIFGPLLVLSVIVRENSDTIRSWMAHRRRALGEVTLRSRPREISVGPTRREGGKLP